MSIDSNSVDYAAHQRRRAEDYIARAKALLEAGFTTKQAKKDAIDYISRAYEILFKDAIGDLLLASRPEGVISIPNGGDELYWGRPDLHVWKAKHADMFRRYPVQVAIANELKALRDRCTAAELAAKLKSKKQIADEARNAVAKTCQICGRPILAERGKIAHHGYQRPGQGWQTSSCYGAMELPFEISRDCLGGYIKILETQLAAQRELELKIKNETIPLTVEYSTGKYDRRGHSIRSSYQCIRENFDALRAEHAKLASWSSDIPITFDRVKQDALRDAARDITQTAQYLKRQQARYDAWKAVA